MIIYGKSFCVSDTSVGMETPLKQNSLVIGIFKRILILFSIFRKILDAIIERKSPFEIRILNNNQHKKKPQKKKKKI